MSDNDDLLGDDIGDQSLADYNLGNEEEEQLLADDYENLPQNVPTSLGTIYDNGVVPIQYQAPHAVEYGPPMVYQAIPEPECVVPNIIVEVPNPPATELVHCTYAPYESPVFETERTVPPAIPAGPLESPQIVPTDINTIIPNGDMADPRERFMSERAQSAQRLPQVRDIPDTLDKVVIPRGGFHGRGRTTWVRHPHPYRRNYRGNYNQRMSYPPHMRLQYHRIRHEHPNDMRLNLRPEIRSDMRPRMRPGFEPELIVPPDMRPEMHLELRLELRPDMPPDLGPDIRPEMRPDIHPELRPDIRPEMRPVMPPEMRPDLRPELRSDLHPERPDIRPHIRPDMRPDIRPDMCPDIGTDMRPDIGPVMRPEMRQDMRPEMRQVMRPGMRQDMRLEMRPDMHPEMRQDMRYEIIPDMHPEIRQDMHPEMRPDMHPQIRLDIYPEIRSDMHPEIRQDMGPELRPDMHPDIRPEMRQDIILELRPDMHPEILPNIRPELRSDLDPEMRSDLRQDLRPDHLVPLSRRMRMDMSPERLLLPEIHHPYRNQNLPRFEYRQPNYELRPPFAPQRPFPQKLVREITPNNHNNMPQVTVRHTIPHMPIDKDKFGLKFEPEVRMLPVQLPPNLPPSLPGIKVLINPHFKGNFQPPIEGLPAYIPTRIQKSPPVSPTLENKYGPIKDIDDAAERFIAEQRNALARAAAGRKFTKRSPQRYIENTTIEIENELAPMSSEVSEHRERSQDEDLLRRQEEFINANRAGLRRRMRSPTPPRRSPSPDRRVRPDTHRNVPDEDTDYKRRLREQERLRERVWRAKEVRRKKNAVAIQEREREILEKERMLNEPVKPEKPDEDLIKRPEQTVVKPTSTETDVRPDTTRHSPELNRNSDVTSADSDMNRRSDVITAASDANRRNDVSVSSGEVNRRSDVTVAGNLNRRYDVTASVKTERVRDRSPLKDDGAEVNSTCETMTPPRVVVTPECERALTPPLPPTTTAPAARQQVYSDDELDIILGDIDGILSEDDDDKIEPPPKAGKLTTKQPDLRAKLPPKSTQTTEAKKSQRQKIVFVEKDDKKKKDKSPPRKAVVSSTKTDDADKHSKKSLKNLQKTESVTPQKNRQRIVFDNKKEKSPSPEPEKKQFPNRRVILQKKGKSVFTRIETKTDPSKPNPGIFSRAVRTAIGDTKKLPGSHGDPRNTTEDPELEYNTDSGSDDGSGGVRKQSSSGNVAVVDNLPHGMTDTRLRTLAGSLVQRHPKLIKACVLSCWKRITTS